MLSILNKLYIACWLAEFHYNVQQKVIHNCNGQNACRESFIQSSSEITLYCDRNIDSTKYERPCRGMVVFWPFNLTKINKSSLTIIGGPQNAFLSIESCVHIFSLNAIPIIICNDKCSLNNIQIIYDEKFYKYCYANDTTLCTINNNNIYNNIITIHPGHSDIYDKKLNFNSYQFDRNIFIILSDYDADEFEFIPPNITNNSMWLSILCIYCRAVIFNLESIPNAAITWIDDVGQIGIVLLIF